MGRDSLLVRVAAAVVLVLTGWYCWHRWGLADRTVAQATAMVAGADTPGSGTLAEGSEAVGLPTSKSGTGLDQTDGQADSAALPPVIVHVAGAVEAPGLYHLPPGVRVNDAIVAAGGTVETADTDRLNLAAHLADGQKVYVPHQGEPVIEASEEAPAVLSVSINQASAKELEALPGIGPVLAGRIVAYRASNGPFRSIDDLGKVSGIGPKVLAQLRPHIRL